MSASNLQSIAIKPIVHYPREVESGRTYQITVDVQMTTSYHDWPYEDEEYPICCVLDTMPIFRHEIIGSPFVVLHRFGGTYGPATFLLTANQKSGTGKIHIKLFNKWGVPLRHIVIEASIVTENTQRKIAAPGVKESVTSQTTLPVIDKKLIQVQESPALTQRGIQFDQEASVSNGRKYEVPLSTAEDQPISTNFTEDLNPLYRSYAPQKCYIAYSHDVSWSEDLIDACGEVLPEMGLEPWVASNHFMLTKSLCDQVLEMIANAGYGIYDISFWRKNQTSGWIMPCNTLIELGIAIALNRPILLLRHASNRINGLPLPSCLESLDSPIIEFGGRRGLDSGSLENDSSDRENSDTETYKLSQQESLDENDHSQESHYRELKHQLRERLTQWSTGSPEQGWFNRYCLFGARVCEYREMHPQFRDQDKLYCHISDGEDADRLDFRETVKEVLDGFDNVIYSYLDGLPIPNGYMFLLCSHCQTVRSSQFAIYRITPHTPAETYIALGISLALEAQFSYKIPKILLTSNMHDIPSLLAGFKVVVVRNYRGLREDLRKLLPLVIQQVKSTTVSANLSTNLTYDVLKNEVASSRNTLIGRILRGGGFKEEDFDERLRDTLIKTRELYIKEYPEYNLRIISDFLSNPAVTQQISSYILDRQPIQENQLQQLFEQNQQKLGNDASSALLKVRQLTAKRIIDYFLQCYRRILSEQLSVPEMVLLLDVFEQTEQNIQTIKDSEERLKQHVTALAQTLLSPASLQAAYQSGQQQLVATAATLVQMAQATQAVAVQPIPKLFSDGLCSGHSLRPAPDRYFVSYGIAPGKLIDWRQRITETLAHTNQSAQLLEPYFSNDKYLSGYRLCGICERIDSTPFGFFLLPVTQDRNVYLELGITIGLGKPFFLFRERDAEIPTVLFSLTPYAHNSSFRTMRRELAGQIEEYEVAAIQFTSNTTNQQMSSRYLIIGGGNFDDEDFEGSIEDSIKVAYPQQLSAFPVSQQVKKMQGVDMLQLAELIQTSHFAIYRVDEQSSPTTFLILGMSIGLSRPFIMISQKGNEIPLNLRGVGIYQFANYTELKRNVAKHHKSFFDIYMQLKQ